MSTLLEEVRAQRRHRAGFSPAMARAIREAAGVSQARLAAEIGVHPITVTRWETGSRRPSDRYLPAYMRVLEQLQAVGA